MPVEILEIVVRANVQEQQAAPQSASTGAGGDNDFAKQQLVEEAVEQMLEVQRRKEER